MIKITFKPDNHTITLKGHAEGYGEDADRIICAAVSAVFYNLSAMLREYPSEAFSMPFVMKEAKSKNGISSIKAVPSNGYESLINHDFYYAMVGFETIAGNYPDAIELVVKR
jgi:uncharacterized protein YsxB (DUF464 family)